MICITFVSIVMFCFCIGWLRADYRRWCREYDRLNGDIEQRLKHFIEWELTVLPERPKRSSWADWKRCAEGD